MRFIIRLFVPHQTIIHSVMKKHIPTQQLLLPYGMRAGRTGSPQVFASGEVEGASASTDVDMSTYGNGSYFRRSLDAEGKPQRTFTINLLQ